MTDLINNGTIDYKGNDLTLSWQMVSIFLVKCVYVLEWTSFCV